MVTVARLIEHYVYEHPFIQEAMSRGILSYGSLADELKPYLEKETKKKVSHASIVMAFRRLEENIKKTFVTKVRFDKINGVLLKSNITEITISKNEKNIKHMQELLKNSKIIGNMTLVQGLNEIAVIISDKYFDLLNFDKDDVIMIKRNLASLSLSLPEKACDIPGYFFTVSRLLAWENISIIEVVSTFREMTFIIKEDDAPKAYSILNMLLR